MKLNKDLIGEIIVSIACDNSQSDSNSCRLPDGTYDIFLPLIKKGYKVSRYKSSWTKGWVSVPLWDPDTTCSWHDNPGRGMYIHMPKDIAEKVMVFEFLPDLDSDCLEKVPRRIH